jgi:hypothetical protein
MPPPWFRSSNTVSRRWMLRWGAAAAAFPFSPLRNTSAHAAADDVEARFLGWCRMATGSSELSPNLAQHYLDLALRSGMTVAELSELDPGEYRSTALEKRLLEAWYTGVFKLDGSADVRNDETTLMWRSAGIDPPPSWCRGDPSAWTMAPSNL